jgi:8-oxo-dGTP diphosphatase
MIKTFQVGVDNVIFSVDLRRNRLLVLLSKRLHEPWQEWWSLPGTLVHQGESLAQAADRILKEKIKVKNLYLEQLYSFDELECDPGENSQALEVYSLSVSYFALVRFEEAELIATEGGMTAWFFVPEIPPLACDRDRILRYGYRRLQNKLAYSPIAFDVLPTVFTLNELYQFYGTVLGENFADYSNFRSRLLKLGFLKDTGLKSSRGAGRPAKLYRFDAESFAPFKDKPMVFI